MDIYIIKNSVNSKVYVGQSQNVTKRFKQHYWDSRRNLGKAMEEIGIEYFWYEILEHNVDNSDDREKYWIQRLSSLEPNGYNISDGGLAPPVNKGIDNNKSIFKQCDIDDIYSLLNKNYLTDREIGELYGVGYHTIQRINHGHSYKNNCLSYPIRKYKIPANRIHPNTVDSIIKEIITTKKSFRQIAKDHQLSSHTVVVQINNGSAKVYRNDNLTYPLRKP